MTVTFSVVVVYNKLFELFTDGKLNDFWIIICCMFSKLKSVNKQTRYKRGPRIPSQALTHHYGWKAICVRDQVMWSAYSAASRGTQSLQTLVIMWTDVKRMLYECLETFCSLHLSSEIHMHRDHALWLINSAENVSLPEEAERCQ